MCDKEDGHRYSETRMLSRFYVELLTPGDDLDLASSSFLIYSANEFCDLRHHFFLVRYSVTLLVQHQRP